MTKRKAGEGAAPHVPNPIASAFGVLAHALARDRDPEGYRKRQQRAQAGLARRTPEQQEATRAKRKATWRAKKVAFLKAEAEALAQQVKRVRPSGQADAEGLPRAGNPTDALAPDAP